MATNPTRDPIDVEIERVLHANAGLLEELQEYDRWQANGEDVGEFLSSDELRRRLGLPRPPAPDLSGAARLERASARRIRGARPNGRLAGQAALCWTPLPPAAAATPRVRRTTMPRIGWIEDADATGELAEIYEAVRSRHPTGAVPPILRTMSHRPDFLTLVNEAANVLHFRDGTLSRAQHEMIASHVAALNRCRY
jgi:hypothetical protein